MKRFFIIFVLLIVIGASVSACEAVALLQPTATLEPTNTPIPPSNTPLPTNTAVPTATFTQVPTESPTEAPPTMVPTPLKPTATPNKDEAILVFYINKDEKGPYGCNEALWWLNTGMPKSGNLVNDITYALNTILGYHNPTIGILHNPGFASNLSVGGVMLQSDGTVIINLSGVYNSTDDSCDGPRFRDQLKQTVRQFTGVTNVLIYVNGFTIGDTILRK